MMKEMLPSGKASNKKKCEKTFQQNSNTEDLFRLLKRPALKFIYPQPVYVNIHSKTQPMFSTKQLNKQTSGIKTENQSVTYLDSPQSNLQEMKKSLDFSSEPVVNVLLDRSSHTLPAVAFQQKEVHVIDSLPTKFATDDECLKQISLNLDETKDLPFSRNQGEADYSTSSNDDQKHCEIIASRNVFESVGFSTAAGKKVSISEKAMIQARARLEEIDKEDIGSKTNPSIPKESNILIKKQLTEKNWNSEHTLQNFDHLKTVGFSTAKGKPVHVSDEAMSKGRAMFAEVNEAPSSDVLKYQETVGFSTAGGKKFSISEKAMIRARAKFEEIDEEDLTITKHQVTRSNTKINYSREKRMAENDWNCDNMLPQNSDIPKAVGFSSAKGKPIHISDEAMAKGQTMFAEVSGNPLSNPSSITSAYPETVGFSTAGGKKVAISETAIVRAKSLFSEFEDANVDPTEFPATASCSRANVKKSVVSKEAIARGQALLEDVCEKNTEDEHGGTTKTSEKYAAVPKQNLSRSGDSRIRAKTSSFKAPRRVTPVPEPASHGLETTDCNPVQVPLTVGFNLASGKEVKVSELALSRARKNFEEPLVIEEIPKIVETVQAVNINHNSSPSPFPVKDENADKKRKMEEEDDKDYWVSSPTIGKTKKAKKRKNFTDSPRSQLTQMATPGTPSAFESSTVSAKIRALRRKAREEQNAVIQRKRSKGRKPSPKAGYLYQQKKDGTCRKTWKELIDNSSLPEIVAPYKLLEDHGMLAAVYQVQASSASSFNFCAWDHFPIEDCLQNSKGVQLGKLR
jgi:breast cancer 2 susceptibility protein